jgi:predicted exporter
VKTAEDRIKALTTQQVWVLVGSPATADALSAAEEVEKALLASGVVKPFAMADQAEALGRALFPYRALLLSQQDRDSLKAGAEQAVVERALAQVLSPFGLSNAQLLQTDPLGLFPRTLADLGASRLKLQRGKGGRYWVGDAQKRYVVLVFTLDGSAFDLGLQERFVGALDGAESQLSIHKPSVDILRFGAVFYAAEGVERGKSEASLFGTLSLLGVIALAWLVFRQLRPLGLNMLAVLSGMLIGFAVTVGVFGQVHIMALIFGAGVIGVATDYTFHYCCEGIAGGPATGWARVAAVRSGLTLGMVSSVTGFLILAATPFPGLQQIALFSAVGLLSAYLCVLGVYPFLDRGGAYADCRTAMRLAAAPRLFWLRPTLRPLRLVVLAVLVGLAVVGGLSLRLEDDVRRLQPLSADLKAQEEQVKALSGLDTTSRAFLVHGDSDEQALEREESLLFALDPLVRKGDIAAVQGVSQVVPSARRQAENAALLDRLLTSPALDLWQQALGQPLSGQSYDTAHPVLTLGDLADFSLVQAFALAPGVHVVRLQGVAVDPVVLAGLASQHDGVVYLDQVSTLNQMMDRYRQRAIWSLGFAVAVIAVFLSVRYGVRRAVRTMLPPVAAIVLTPTVTAAMGQSFGLINALALILVFAIGLDFVLFRREATAEAEGRVDLANALSALSTLLAFGLLAFSEMPALRSFGVVIVVGIILAYLLAPWGVPVGERVREEGDATLDIK